MQKIPVTFITVSWLPAADRVTLIILEEQKNKENEGRGEIPAAKGSSVSRHLQQLPALGGPCRWAGTERLCNRGELCQVLSPDTSQTTSMAPASEEEKQQGHAWVMVLMTGEFLAGSCGAERFPLPEHYGKSCSQLSISFRFLTSLQNRRSQRRGFFDRTDLMQFFWLILCELEAQVHSKVQGNL